MTTRSLLAIKTALFGLAWLWITAFGNAAIVLVDFGATATTTDAISRVWNNVSATTDLTGSPFTLLASGGTDSGYRLTISNPSGVTNAIGFNGNNANGTTSPTGSALAHNYPSTATSDSAYGNTVTFSSAIVESVRLTLSNLDPNERYSFDFFASRIGAGGDNRETEYLITGGAAGTAATSVYLNASENTGNIVSATGFAPNASNQIVIDIDRGPNNTNANGFFYLGVLEITSVPEPSSIAALAIGGGLLLGRRCRAKRRIHGERFNQVT